jgi:hypothetical protein
MAPQQANDVLAEDKTEIGLLAREHSRDPQFVLRYQRTSRRRGAGGAV